MLLEVHIWPTTDAAPSGSLVATGYEVLGVGASIARRILDESRRDCWRESHCRIWNHGALVAVHAGNLPYGVSGEFGAGAVRRRGNRDGHGYARHAGIRSAEERIRFRQSNRDRGWRGSGWGWCTVSGFASSRRSDRVCAKVRRWLAAGG